MNLTSNNTATLDTEVTENTLDFIDRAVGGDPPFFVCMAPARAHVWTHLSPEYEAMLGNGRGLQDVVMKELDDNVGKVLAHLEDLGTSDDTIVVFTPDNGPETLTWPDGGTTPFRGEKGTTWEGGFRVPAIVRWPGKVPEGRVANSIFPAWTGCRPWSPQPEGQTIYLLSCAQVTKGAKSTWMATTNCPN